MSFSLAFLGHTVFFFLFGFVDKEVAPQLVSKKSISITLSHPVVEPKRNHQPQVAHKQDRKQKELESPVEKMVKKIQKENIKKLDSPPLTIIQDLVKTKHLDPHNQVNAKTKTEPESITSKVPTKHSKVVKEEPTPTHSVAQATISRAEAKPLYQDNPKPHYPALAQRRGWQGTVILTVRVLEDGTTDNVRLYESSGHKLLDRAARKAVQKWRFLPGTKNGVPVPMEILIPVLFLLTE